MEYNSIVSNIYILVYIGDTWKLESTKVSDPRVEKEGVIEIQSNVNTSKFVCPRRGNDPLRQVKTTFLVSTKNHRHYRGPKKYSGPSVR